MAGQTQLIPENLPVGWRFHPSDEELLTHYLMPKLLNQPINGSDVKFVELSKYDPWDLLAEFKKNAGDKEMYFFSPCEYSESNGNRKRKAGSGYWKSTGNPRPVRLEDDDNQIGTKRSLTFHNPDATEFTITEYAYTAELNSHIMKGLVLCKLKKKPKKYKGTSKKPKKAKPDCKKKTRPHKKARKTESSNGNSMVASALTSGNRNAKMICNSTYSECEQSNYMASYSENQHPNKTTPIPAYDEGQSTYSTSTTETMYRRNDNLTCYNDESTYPIVNQLTTTSSFNKGKEEDIVNLDFDSQNPTKNTDISVTQEGEWNPRMVAPFDFDNQNQYKEADMSGNYWCSLLDSIGDSTIQGVQSGKKDMPILENIQVPLTTSDLADDAYSTIQGVQSGKKDMPILEDIQVPSTTSDLADDASPNKNVRQWLEKFLEL